MTNPDGNEKNEELLIDWVPNFIAEMPLHLQLTKIILSKVYAVNTGKSAYLPASKKLSQKFRVPESVIIEAYDRLENLGLVTVVTGTRLRILSQPAGDLAGKVKLVSRGNLQSNPRHFLPRTQII